ncbi:SRPBCC family protein [Mangrovibacterium lignilyticum]|uniref:SRPBCC family protein n=1 Tax=Mangrovibacterium lignilyticum TaxID=2668052 RepID=UPI0013D26079|nr:SRPBCC domain-containing protein [Mangrovibacterium lignilyticum]
MENNRFMDFTIDKINAIVHVKREFRASVARVWAAWSQAELLDKWWAPRPYVAITRSLDFREGGQWIYSMVGPEGDEHFCRVDYKAIQPLQSMSWLDAFTNAEGEQNVEFPRSDWHIEFSGEHELTMIHVKIKHEKLSDLERILEMGFKDGFTMALYNLDELLEQS